jgi:hypothetical protein
LGALRHYPDPYHFTQIAEKLPEHFSVNSPFVRLDDEQKN